MRRLMNQLNPDLVLTTNSPRSELPQHRELKWADGEINKLESFDMNASNETEADFSPMKSKRQDQIEYYQERACCVCGESDGALLFDQPIESIIGIGNIGYHHLINGCTKCGFTYANPILKEEYILRYYTNMSNYELPESNGIRPPPHRAQIARQIEIIKSRFDNSFVGNALDIGCSIPLGLSMLQQEGWKVLGLDPSDTCIAIAKEKLNVEVLKGFFSVDLLPKNQTYDVIVLSHVLEHLVNPNQILREISNLLSAGGLVYIEVPDHMNINGVKTYFDFEHVNYFTSVSLTNLVQQNGFEVDSLRNFQNSREIHPNYPVISCTIRKRKSEDGIQNIVPIVNDFEETARVIRQYESSSKELMAHIEHNLQKIVSATSSGKLALWGAGIHTCQLLSQTCLKFTPINCIFDNDPKRAGNNINLIPVKLWYEDAVNDLEAIVISSEASEDKIYDQLKHLEERGLKIYRIYANLQL
jgi:2-polyprenyl-3-methyl-5-hydroxy-6-metoxy-1,4-benzoquinol methylase